MRTTLHFLLIFTLGLPAAAAQASPRASANCGPADADGRYFTQRAEGWFWYCDPAQALPEKKKNPAEPSAPASAPADPQAELQAYQKRLEDARAAAVMHPRDEGKVKRYMTLQLEATERSGLFADTWRRVLWGNPDLDTTVSHPVTTVGVALERDLKRAAQADAVRALGRTEGLFFFYQASCPYCAAQAPILLRFARAYGLQVKAVSLDGSGLPEFPDAVPDNGLARQIGVSVTPAIFMANPRTRTITPVAFGIQSESELLERIHALTQARPGEF